MAGFYWWPSWGEVVCIQAWQLRLQLLTLNGVGKLWAPVRSELKWLLRSRYEFFTRWDPGGGGGSYLAWEIHCTVFGTCLTERLYSCLAEAEKLCLNQSHYISGNRVNVLFICDLQWVLWLQKSHGSIKGQWTLLAFDLLPQKEGTL